MRAATRENAAQASKRTMCRPTRRRFRGRLIRLGEMSEDDAQPLHQGYWRRHVHEGKRAATTGSPTARSGGDPADRTPARERPGAHGVAERLAVPVNPGNAGGGKGPQFKTDAGRSGTWRLGDLSTPDSVQKLQTGVARESEGRTRLSLLTPSTCGFRRSRPGIPIGSRPPIPN